METETQTIQNDMVAEMAEVGVIFGHKKSKTHPRMKPYIGGNKNEIELIDPEATFLGLQKAISFFKESVKKGGLMLLVGTDAPAKEGIGNFASIFSFPYVVTRWLGGTLTNFSAISSRLKYFLDLKERKEKGELSKYTKKERQEFDKDIGKMTKTFGGLTKLSRLPDIIFVVDIKTHKTAILEAHKMKIPIIAIVDTDDDPTLVDYPIFANDHNKQSIEWVFNKIIEEVKPNKESKKETKEEEK